jgi:hypothetical protein
MERLTMETQTIERWHVVGFRESVHRDADGHTRAGSSCERCSQAIRYVVTVKSSLDGSTMDVGQDCAITLKGGPELAAIRAAERAYYAELGRPEREAREARERTERDELRAAVAARNAVVFKELLADLDLVVGSDTCVDFERSRCADIASKLRDGTREDGLSDHVTNSGYCEAWMVAGALVDARAGAHRHHAAAIGDRVTVSAALVRTVVLRGEYGTTYLGTFRTDDGATLVWRSSIGIGWDAPGTIGGYHRVLPGERVDLVATVKGHGNYRGEKQTTITRAKVFAPGTAPRARGRKAA